MITFEILFELGGAGATLATVLWSDTSNYCAVSSVAAPPRHPAPSISNTSIVPRGCARESVVSRYDSYVLLVHVLPVVRESASSRNEVYLTCTRSCHWSWEWSEVARTKNEASLLVRESEVRGANTVKWWREQKRAISLSQIEQGESLKLNSFWKGAQSAHFMQELYTTWYCTNCFCREFCHFPSGRDTLIFPTKFPRDLFFNMLGSWVTKGYKFPSVEKFVGNSSYNLYATSRNGNYSGIFFRSRKFSTLCTRNFPQIFPTTEIFLCIISV